MVMILEIKNGGYVYEKAEKPVFSKINFSVTPGEVLCILGPNGVGKTTLLKSLSGLLDLSQGNILCKGKDLKGMKRLQVAKIMAHVTQIHHPVFSYTVFEAVLMGRTPYIGFFSFPNSHDQKQARQAIESMGISHLADKNYTEISGGERQLVMFARALVQEPELIILDEPTSHLDYGNQIKVLSLIHELSRKGTAVIMTTHNPDHAFMIADKVGVMFNQHIAGFDTPQEVITEEILSEIYGINVSLRQDANFGKVCVPILNKKDTQ